ncbi:Flp family type IVb pilin [Lacticigenium naphthae]|uniref:Flp family type IVb pilin n=1 Tax=Lacticigenium naphthae TaxID=515351 RepID=UPI000412409C|nr:hypothetical protein [Lacticigenium naphthae]
MNLLKRFWNEEEGQGLVEYALIIGLVAVIAVAVFAFAGDKIVELFENVFGNIDDAADVTVDPAAAGE